MLFPQDNRINALFIRIIVTKQIYKATDGNLATTPLERY